MIERPESCLEAVRLPNFLIIIHREAQNCVQCDKAKAEHTYLLKCLA
jgi:hypothetical protein